MPWQAFLLDSNATGYSAALTALASYTNAKQDFTDAQVLRDASHDSTLKVVFANITEAELDADGDLANLRTANYPTELCRHRWSSMGNFRALGGFHMLNESVRSRDGAAGRSMVHIRPQQNKGDGTGDNYGAGTGNTQYDALNGPQDPALDGGATTNYQTVISYCIHSPHTRWGDLGPGGNPGFGNGVAGNGALPFEDATGAASDEIRVYFDWDMDPGLFFGTYTLWESNTDLPWEEYDTGIYVNGGFQSSASGGNVGSTASVPEADIDDPVQDADTLIARHILKGKASLSDLNGDNGRARYHVQSNGAAASWDAVHVWNGSSFTDVTAAANDATADDFEIFAASAPDGAYIAFVSSTPFSGAFINLSQVRSGGTLQLEYSQGSGSYSTFTNAVDESSGFTSGTGSVNLQFNPKSDWATDTVNGDTGYVIRYRKTGGTITQAARGDQITKYAGACFVHRWNDSAPTRGLCSWGLGGDGTGFGLHFDDGGSAKGNLTFIRPRMFCTAVFGGVGNCTDITFEGGQLVLVGENRFSSGTPAWTYKAAAYGTRYYPITDHRHQDKTDSHIQDILTEIQRAIDDGINFANDGIDPDLTAFDDLQDWLDIAYVGVGLYFSGSGSPANTTLDGVKWRHLSDGPIGFDDTELFDIETNDKHGLANYGSTDGTNFQTQRCAYEVGTAIVDWYPQATGEGDAPVSGSSSSTKNVLLAYGYCSGWNGKDDSGQPLAGIRFEGDADRDFYDNDTGGDENNEVWFWGFKDLHDGSGGGVGLTNTMDMPPKGRYLVFDNCGEAWATVGNNGPYSVNSIRETSGPSFTDITDNIKNSGNTATDLFDTGAADEAIYFGVKYHTINKLTVTITTAGIGGPTLAVEYYNGSSYTAVSNLSDGTSGLTTSGDITFDRPTDWAQDTIDGKTIYPVRIRIASGSFSTIPQSDQVTSRTRGGALDIQKYTVKNIDTANGAKVGQILGGNWGTDTGYIIDDHARIELSGGQSSATDFFRRVSGGAANETLAEYQANSKSKTDTEAEVDSVFGPNHQLIAA